MRIAVISDLATQGGAAIAATRLVEGLRQRGHTVLRVVGLGDDSDDAVSIGVPFPPFTIRAIARVYPGVRTGWSRRRAEREIGRRLAEFKPDVINVHNLHGVNWSAELVETAAAYAPVVWTLHDMWSFTGRCAYSYDCELFLTGCDASCPTADEYPALAPSEIARAWSEKAELLAQSSSVVAVTPSEWLANQARRGLWKGREVQPIPNGVPLDVYRPIDRKLARQSLGLPDDLPVLLIVAQHLEERRKGGSLLIDALGRFQARPVRLLTMGNGRLPFETDGIVQHPMGFIGDEEIKVLAYSAADLLVHPAPIDNFPNVVAEAIACGTPVVGLPVGGVGEMVEEGVSGWLAAEPSAPALAGAVDRALVHLAHADLRQSCRDFAEGQLDSSLQVSRYIHLFARLRKEGIGTAAHSAVLPI